MQFRNAEGRAVDPVPFLVLAISACLVSFSFGPIYLRAWGLPLDAAVAGSTLPALVGVVGAYYRFVWTYRPEVAREVPVASRMARLGYGMVIFALVLVALALPLWL